MYYEDEQRLLKQKQAEPKSFNSLLTSGVCSSIKLPETKPTKTRLMTDQQTIDHLKAEIKARDIRLENAVKHFKEQKAEIARLTAKLDEHEKKKTNDTDIVEQIYNAYPKKIDKKRALQSIKKAIIDMKNNGGTAENLLETVKQYRREVERHGLNSKHEKWASIPHPTTWFNQNRFELEPAEWTSLFREGKHVNIEKPKEAVQEPVHWRKVLKALHPGSDPGRWEYAHFKDSHPDVYQEVRDNYNLVVEELGL